MNPTVVRDVVIVVPGIMGSELFDRDGRSVWSLRGMGLVTAVRALGGSIGKLTLSPSLGDDDPGDGVTVGAMMPALHVVPGLWRPIAGYSGLVDFLTGRRFHLLPPDPNRPDVIPNLVPFPYDWRLSCRLNGKRLAAVAVQALERWQRQPGMGDARLVLVCHSMGGLVARWFLEQEGGAEHTRALITIGTPHRGAVRAYETLVNGLDLAGWPLRSLNGFARSMPSLHQLLPQYRCLDERGDRSTLAAAAYPGLDGPMARDAAEFHDSITPNELPSYALHKVVGTRQPTLTTASYVDGRVRALPTIDGQDQWGDGTVPRLAAEPVLGRNMEVHEVSDQHGELHGTRSVLDLVDGILTRTDLIFESEQDDLPFGVETDDIHPEGQAVALNVTGTGDRRHVVTVLDEQGVEAAPPVPVAPDGTAVLEPLPAGAYRARVQASGSGAPPGVTHPFLVWPAEAP